MKSEKVEGTPKNVGCGVSDAEQNILLILIMVGKVNFVGELTKINDLQGLFNTWFQNFSAGGLLLRMSAADVDRDRVGGCG